MWRLVNLSAVIVVMSSPVNAANVIQQAVEKANPCSVVQYKTVFSKVRVDRFKGFQLHELNLDIKNDEAKLKTSATLSCRTSDAALIKGDVSGKFAIESQFNIASCDMNGFDIKLVSSGGSFGKILDTFAPDVERKLEETAIKEIKEACEKMR